MNIALVGMSGVGKTAFSQKLKVLGFEIFCVDALIEKRLKIIDPSFSFSGIGSVANWLGFPGDAQYQKSSRAYMQVEKEVMLEIFQQISNKKNKNVVIDTTGSVVYQPKEFLACLQKICKIVFLTISPERLQELNVRYTKNPKPLIWPAELINNKNNFKKNIHKNFFALLENREKFYKKISDIELINHEQMSDEEIIKIFK
jgi:shikimate kinase